MQFSKEYQSPNSFFASFGKAGMGVGISPNPASCLENSIKRPGFHILISLQSHCLNLALIPQLVLDEALEAGEKVLKKKGDFKLRTKIGNLSLWKLISGAVAGAVSLTAVVPLETIRTHLLVGSSGNSTGEVFDAILKTDGWKGLFRGNFVNVIGVARSKAIEVRDKEFCVQIWILDY